MGFEIMILRRDYWLKFFGRVRSEMGRILSLVPRPLPCLGTRLENSEFNVSMTMCILTLSSVLALMVTDFGCFIGGYP